MKTAIVYDRVNKWGGAEQVLLALHEIFPQAPLYTAIYSSEKASWAKVFPQVIPSFLQKIPYLNQRHELLGTFTPLAFETFNFDDYDLVISATSEAAKGIITKPGTRHICYCLTPTRYLWSGYEEYFKGPAFKGIAYPAVSYLRKWDRIAAYRPDTMIAISKAVQTRIKKYYGRDSQIIYPPVDIKKFKVKSETLPAGRQGSKFKTTTKNLKLDNSPSTIHRPPNTDYYLVVSRLVPYKRVDLAISAFNELGLPLVVVGTGSEEKELRKLAKRNVEFAGFVNDSELIKYCKGAKALIHPQDEDFGITPVEAQAAGCPVVAFRAGGALDTVVEGKTGVFFDKQTVKSLISAVRVFEKKKFEKSDLVENAKRFSKEKFITDFKKLIENGKR